MLKPIDIEIINNIKLIKSEDIDRNMPSWFIVGMFSNYFSQHHLKPLKINVPRVDLFKSDIHHTIMFPHNIKI